MEEAFVRLLKMVQEVAPEMWRLARQQVMIQVITGLLSYIVMANVLVWGLREGVKLIKKPRDDNQYDSDAEFTKIMVGMIMGFGVLLLLLVTVLGLFGYIVPRLLNPDWYAIETLRTLLSR